MDLWLFILLISIIGAATGLWFRILNILDNNIDKLR